MENSVIRERCGVIDDKVTKIEKGILIWFGHLQRIHERDVRIEYE